MEDEEVIAAAAAREEETSHSNLNLSITLLVNSIPQTNCFKPKWSLISSKLTTLQSHISDLSKTSNLFPDLLHSLHSTLSDALSLSLLCHSLTPPHGKLMTQNELDSLTARLDLHINDLDVIIKSGVLSNRNVVLVSRRESTQAEFRNLITRLQIGSPESKNSAVDSVLSLLQEDDKNVLIAVAQGIVPVLVRLLDSNSHHLEIKEKSVTAIAKISTVDSIKHVLISEGLGLLHNLLRLLDSGGVFAKEKSCIVLQALSQTKENARAIASRGGISSILEICNSGTPVSQATAAGVLKNLSAFPEIKASFIEENAVTILLGLLNAGTILAQENAIACLINLIVDDDEMKLLIAREGVIEALNNCWDSVNSAPNPEVAVDMIRILSTNPIIAQVIIENGFLNRVIRMISCGVLRTRISAAKAVFELTYNTKTRKEAGDMGCISPLVAMLDGKAIDEKLAAAKALSNLLVYEGNRKYFRREEKGIANAVKLLDPLVQNLDKKYPILILSLLVRSKKCRKQMLALGARRHLQKLVEADVEGGKRLQESLSHGKLWGVFTRR